MEGGVPLVRATNVKNGTIVDEDMLYIDPVSVPQGRMASIGMGDNCGS